MLIVISILDCFPGDAVILKILQSWWWIGANVCDDDHYAHLSTTQNVTKTISNNRRESIPTVTKAAQKSIASDASHLQPNLKIRYLITESSGLRRSRLSRSRLSTCLISLMLDSSIATLLSNTETQWPEAVDEHTGCTLELLVIVNLQSKLKKRHKYVGLPLLNIKDIFVLWYGSP